MSMGTNSKSRKSSTYVKSVHAFMSADIFKVGYKVKKELLGGVHMRRREQV